MRIKIGALLLALAAPAFGGDFGDTAKPVPPSYKLEDRVQIPVRLASNGKVRYVSTLSARAVTLPLFQIGPNMGGGGGSSSITGGTTPITVCLDTQVLFDDGVVVGCDPGMVYNKTTDALAVGGFVRVGDGSVTNPSFSFNSDLDTGFWWRANNSIEVNCGGGHCFSFNNSAVLTGGSGSQFGIASTAAATNAADVGFRRLAAGVWGTTLGGANAGWLQVSGGDLALNADYTNATATFSNTTLVIPNVAVARTYSFEVAFMLSESTAADGVKIDFAGGSATATNFRVSCVLTNEVGAIVTQAAATSTTLGGVINATATVTTAQHLYKCSGTLVPSGAGTFIPRAGQNAHTTGTLTIHRGSWILMRDVSPL